MKKYLIIICMFFFMIVFVQAGGISTPFAEVKIENIEPGKTYKLKDFVNKLFNVKNTADIKIKLIIEVISPEKIELKEGYLPIPDTNWIKLEKNLFEILPGEEATTDVIFSIPKKKEYYDKKYQVYIWSHTIPTEGVNIAVGLKSRFLLSTIKKKNIIKKIFNK